LIPYRNPQELEKQASARIIVEHVMGILKGRWCSLKGLRVKIKTKKDTEKVNGWILSCLILHNMVTQFNDDWSDEMESDIDVSQDEELEEDGIEFRERIRESLE
jgi:putative aminopeptidase FrvX